MNRIPALDGIRGIAILMVLVCHAWPFEALPVIPAMGANGVDLFFVLSGYLITAGLLASRGTEHYFRDFYVKRVLRLAPLYFGYLAVAALLLPTLHRAAGTSMPDFAGPWWPYLAYVNNWMPIAGTQGVGHLWSLAIEEQFYVVWPVVVLLLPTRALAWTCGAIMAGSFALRAQPLGWETLYHNTFTRIDLMAAGALIACCGVDARLDERVRRYVGHAVIAALLVVAGVAASGHLSHKDPVFRLWGQAAVLVFAFAAIHRAAIDRWEPRLLMNSTLRKWGTYCYCIYLIHVAILTHMGWIGAAVARRYPVAGPWAELALAGFGVYLSFVIAEWSWHHIEEPIISLRKVLLRKRTPAERRVAVVA